MSLSRRPAAITSRIERLSDRSGGPAACWPWQGFVDSTGYGKVRMLKGKAPKRAHRIAYEIARGPIPTGLTIDHLCRNRRCVNPTHLEAVPLAVNIQRGVRSRAVERVACRAGHPYSRPYIVGAPQRRCVECRRLAQKRRRAA